MPMATYLYCVRSDPVAPSDSLVGIDGRRVRVIEVDDLMAWVSDVDAAPVDVTVDRLRSHDTVCAAALESGETPLPVRFGQTFIDDRSAVAGIESRAADLRVRLARIAGCVEIRVVITRGREGELGAGVASPGDSASETDAPPGGDPEGPGTAFLKRLARAGRVDLAREVGCEEVRHAIRGAAHVLIVDQQRCETARGFAFFPVLVRREDVVRFRDVVANTLSYQAIDLSVLGPFAPYSFSGDA